MKNTYALFSTPLFLIGSFSFLQMVTEYFQPLWPPGVEEVWHVNLHFSELRQNFKLKLLDLLEIDVNG